MNTRTFTVTSYVNDNKQNLFARRCLDKKRHFKCLIVDDIGKIRYFSFIFAQG